MAEAPPELAAEIRKLEQKHAENPAGRYFVPLANAFRKAGDLARAEALLRDGLRRHPDYLSAHIVLGRCLADRGAAQEAVIEFRHVLGIDPQNLIALRTLGEIAIAEGHTEDAERWYGELLAVDPMNEDAREVLDSLAAASEPAFEPVVRWWETPADDEPEPEAPEPEEPEEAELEEANLEEADPAARQDHKVEEDELVTETIAELYARQGFPDRAAGVYRELLRRGGSDPRLRVRLAELETSAEAESDVAPEAEAVWESGDTVADAFGASFAHGFAGSPEPAAVAAGVEGEEEDEEFGGIPFVLLPSEPEVQELPVPDETAQDEPTRGDAVASVSVSDGITPAGEMTVAAFFAELLGWRPTSGESEAPAGASGPPEEAGESAAPFSAAPGEPKEAPGEPWQSDAEVVAGFVGDEPFPWELPTASPPPNDSFSLDTFFAGDAISADEADEFEPSVLPGDPADVGSDPEPAEEEEEDDLESFQAWLKSLQR